MQKSSAELRWKFLFGRTVGSSRNRQGDTQSYCPKGPQSGEGKGAQVCGDTWRQVVLEASGKIPKDRQERSQSSYRPREGRSPKSHRLEAERCTDQCPFSQLEAKSCTDQCPFFRLEAKSCTDQCPFFRPLQCPFFQLEAKSCTDQCPFFRLEAKSCTDQCPVFRPLQCPFFCQKLH